MAEHIRVAFIYSLGHSGSTILDALLSTHPAIVGCGELFDYVSSKRHTSEGTGTYCSCGEIVSNCPLWSQVIRDNGDANDRLENYEHTLFTLYKIRQKIIVDSSKYQPALLALSELSARGIADLLVVYLTKDPRDWVFSMQRVYQKTNRTRPVEYLFMLWLYRSLKHRLHLLLSDKQVVVIRYEHLTAKTTRELNKVFDALKIEPLQELELSNADSHILLANRTKYTFLSEGLKQPTTKNYDVRLNLLYFVFKPLVSLLRR